MYRFVVLVQYLHYCFKSTGCIYVYILSTIIESDCVQALLQVILNTGNQYVGHSC